jgi:hypothetical protein
LAKDIDVDRSIVTEWFKRFSKLPERYAVVPGHILQSLIQHEPSKASVAACAVSRTRS